MTTGKRGVPPARSTPASEPTDAEAAAAREAKGSVHEAIGKLIGDDAARDHGRAERRAGAAANPTPPKD